MPRNKSYPPTVPAAVEFCLKRLPVRTLEVLLHPEADVCDHHFGLGMWIRNNLGLWRGNAPLMEAIGACHPDDASEPIIRALVAYLHKHKDWKLRRRLLRAPKSGPADA